MDGKSLSPLSNALMVALEGGETAAETGKITVNALVSKLASWYEKIRNAMDYREEEVILRAAIERILKRRLILGGSGKTIAAPLVRELVWARYFPNNSLSESIIEKVRRQIDLHLDLRHKILAQHRFSEKVINEWTYHLISSDLAYQLSPKKEKELVANYMFQLIRHNVKIVDDTEQAKDVQVFIAIRRSFAKDDIAFLRYHMFNQIFGQLTGDNLETISASFLKGYREIQKQLNYSRKDRIYTYIKGRTAVFFILQDLLQVYGKDIRHLVADEKGLTKAVFSACDARYKSISSKVTRAIIRSVFFLLLTKAIFAFFVEGSIEKMMYGKVLWVSMLINIAIPPILMIFVGLLIRPPGRDNSVRILNYIKKVLFEENPTIGDPLTVKKTPDRISPLLDTAFTLLWLLTFIVSFGILVYVLTRLRFHLISQAIFIFFLTIVSFMSYRIRLTSKIYAVDERQGVLAPLVDFFFMPVIRVGRHLTEGIAQINIIIFLFDFVIETPFKVIFSFFEQLFFFLHAKREELE